jgi:hypothetical protein
MLVPCALLALPVIHSHMYLYRGRISPPVRTPVFFSLTEDPNISN